MPVFPSDSNYSNVNEIAAREDLLWDGHYGSPYEIDGLIDATLRDDAEMRKYSRLFDHTKRFKPRGSGKKRSVMAISSPYLNDSPALRNAVAEFAARFGLNARVNDPQDRIYNQEATIPILFWRPDLHTLRG